MVALCRLQSVSLNPVFLPPAPHPHFSFSSRASLSQHAADRQRHDIRLLRSVLEPAAPHHFSFAFCFQVELVSVLVNNQWEALQVPVHTLCLFYGSIIWSRAANLALVGIQCRAQGHLGRKDANVIEAWTWTSSLKEYLWFSLNRCSFRVNVGCQYMLYDLSFPLT